MSFINILFLIGFLFISNDLIAAELKLLWSVEGQFSMPESAAYDPKRKVVYVSNVNQYAKDNNGFISRVSEDGSRLELKWLMGLHSPTGITVAGDKLYAVDFDALVIIDLNEERIIQRVEAEDAEAPPVLNDVASGSNGDLFVSGSSSRKIYKLHDNKLITWLHSSELLKHANGLLVHKNTLLHGGEVFSAFDIESKAKREKVSKMGEGLFEFDGITKFADDAFIVSLIDDPRLWLLRIGAAPEPFSEQKLQGIDMEYVADKKLLFLPRVGNTLSAYRVGLD